MFDIYTTEENVTRDRYKQIFVVVLIVVILCKVASYFSRNIKCNLDGVDLLLAKIMVQMAT